MNWRRFGLVLGFVSLLAVSIQSHGGSIGRTDLQTLRTPVYVPEGDAIVRHNGERFNNRPLYCNQISAVVLAGDRPLVRFGNGAILNGTFMVALVRGKSAKWLHDWSDITSRYRPDRMEWKLQDSSFGDTVLTLEAVPPAEGAGMAMRLRIEKAQPGDRLIWAFGGAVPQKKSVINDWDVTTAGRESLLARKFSPDDCGRNRVTVRGDHFTVRAAVAKGLNTAEGHCSAAGKMAVADAAVWADPLKLAGSSGKERPLVCATVKLEDVREIFWAMQVARDDKSAAASSLSPEKVFAAGRHRAETIGGRVVIDTPDPELNAMVAASTAVMDGVFRDGIFTHSGMRWGVPLLGWRTMFGGTVYGWHDRVKTQARICLARQITRSDKARPQADAQYGLTSQSLKSRLFGSGRVDVYQPWHYDMQSQFFDQLIHAWRWTGDAALEKMLRPALELHLEYIRECFDPDDDGLYESYANTWPTDDQWYNGGGTAEETAYAYAGHKAALEMARRAGDETAAKRHEARLAKIHKSFMKKLWISSKGYVGSYVEQGGHGRLHEDSWLYAIFCPIDAGMLPIDLAAKSLYYTEWGLEREKMPYGGQRCWPSNWVPSIWSLREMWPGDNYHLSLAYFQTGLADDGWSLLRGTFPHMGFYGPVPGDLGFPNGATDFNDCASMFCRTVVEGLFGYRPDYPNGVVTIAPQLPSAWDHASIKTPDFSLAANGNQYRIELTRPATLELRLPVRAKKVTAVTVNGQPVEWNLQPAYGRSEVRVRMHAAKAATVEVVCAEPLPQFAAIPMEVTAGENPHLSVGDAKLLDYSTFPTTAGYHLVEAMVQIDQAYQRRLFKVKVNDPKAEALQAAKTLDKPPADAKWDCLDLSRQHNGDIRAIFRQNYVSPRPETCSLRLATDGYSTWQMILDPKHKPPTIDLANVSTIKKDGDDRLRTPQGVPFAWGGGERNIAFTSIWDNWPRQITVPVGRKADAIWLLVCGFTNPMQGRIANAEIRMKYADGKVETLELVPPMNFWSLCPFGEADYDYKRDGFSLPMVPPATVQLGKNCRAILLNRRLRPDVALESVTLETLSQEVIIGLMGASLMNPR